MKLGFFDADELRARHTRRSWHAVKDREAYVRQLDGARRAVDASWRTLARSKEMVEEADRFGREREINLLVDDLVAHQCEMIAMKDDGAMLAAIFPLRSRR